MVSISSHVFVYWCKNSCKNSYGNSNCFEIKVSMQQGSALSPLLFVTVTEALSRKFRVALPWELMYTDDLVVIAETEGDLIKRLNKWKDYVENRGMRVNMNKTKVMISGERQKVVDKSCYLSDTLSVDGDAHDVTVETRIRTGCNKFRQLMPLLTNKDTSLIVRGRLYSCVRSSMLHGSETWRVRKENEVALQQAQMRMV